MQALLKAAFAIRSSLSLGFGIPQTGALVPGPSLHQGSAPPLAAARDPAQRQVSMDPPTSNYRVGRH